MTDSQLFWVCTFWIYVLGLEFLFFSCGVNEFTISIALALLFFLICMFINDYFNNQRKDK